MSYAEHGLEHCIQDLAAVWEVRVFIARQGYGMCWALVDRATDCALWLGVLLVVSTGVSCWRSPWACRKRKQFNAVKPTPLAQRSHRDNADTTHPPGTTITRLLWNKVLWLEAQIQGLSM